MEILVEFEVNVPDAAPASEIDARYRAEASAAAPLDDWMHVTITSLEAHPNDPALHTAVSTAAGSRS